MQFERLVIAEKPELAKAIVEGLGGGSRKDGYYECGSDRVTWCYGHMLALLDPEDYDERYANWNMADLPIVHIPWRKKPSGDAGAKAQFKTILSLLKQAKSVVHAGDPDDEGQLLVDEILEYANCRLPVQRLLINDNNVKIVRRQLAAMRDNREFAGLSAAAEARSVGDQLYGFNITRLYTLAARAKGYQGLLSVGRVQTPILGLVVRRCRENAAHQKTYYYLVNGQFEVEGIQFPARYQVADGDPVDEKGRLSNKEHAEGIAAAVSGQPARIVSVTTKAKEAAAPLPYNLLKLQMDASRKFGFKPDQVKDITQALREKHKLITYNRSDCEYLSEEQHGDAPGVLAAIAQTAPMLAAAAQRANPTIKSRAFNSSKVSAHHAIIPTESTADLSKLTDAEQKIYLLIARAYVAQFWPKHLYDQTDVLAQVGDHRFGVRSNVTTSPGWKILYKNDAGNEDLEGNADDIEQDLRKLRDGQAGTCTDAKAEQQETKPQPLYTMESLLSDLTRVAKYIRDDRLRKILIEKDKGKQGEHGGIGTPATRDSIIATLFERGYLVEKGKHIVSTPTGEELYDALPDTARFPDMTALWHEQQKAIQAGERDTLSFVNELMEYIGAEVANIKDNGLNMKIDTHPCPSCGKPLRRLKKKDKNEYFWGCTGFADGCKFACDDKGGKPVPREAPKVSELHKCMACGHGLSRRPGKKRGMFWWGCSNFPTCKQTYPDLKGRPDYSKGRNGTNQE
ncbi:TPA: DNA topoisomerase 3 [Escherichia coli]|uniref:DNA topoisomerase n=5 Tax=root TaxID=1 RepID=A0A2R4AH29_ECOLX|nr:MULTISPECIES: DNA topoisomerase 3 [Pseudomonadota]AAA26423.1 TraE [Plasmid RP4]AAU93734.1 TraE [Integration vector pJK202]ADU90753.1 DNA topoisomerase [uncultured bacterium]KJX85301.1 DNA topoisomerase III [Agrobacterium tumefaciens]QCS90209.1 TraE [synthetic construct]BAI47878.1 TraE [Helper vector pRH210]BAI47921.1 TraE [Helper vector pRH220]HDR8934126.1 DNA topoisomerase 3 [Burkholderia vietnamiensis]CAJ85722.1 TPA: TraE putative helicase [Birmingham IncP-alpha plasmid]